MKNLVKISEKSRLQAAKLYKFKNENLLYLIYNDSRRFFFIINFIERKILNKILFKLL